MACRSSPLRHNRLVPKVRQASGRVNNSRRYQLKRVAVGSGLNADALAGKVVDVLSKTADSQAALPLVEHVRIVGVSRTALGYVQTVDVAVNRLDQPRLSQADGDGREFILVRSRNRVLESIFPEVPVAQADFDRVGHALFGILFAYLGGWAGRYFSKGCEANWSVAVSV